MARPYAGSGLVVADSAPRSGADDVSGSSAQPSDVETSQQNNPRLIGDSDAIRRLREKLASIGPTPCNVLVNGETGTGKELVAQEIHRLGGSEKPYVCVECSSLCDTLFESQMFGHVKGSFTGATSDTLGFIRAAHGGTLVLDEVGEINITLQAKLLRCLETHSVVPVGKTKPVPVQVRVVAVTHRELGEMVRNGTFREDLYYRINVVQVSTTPLRSRPSDIDQIVWHYSNVFSASYNRPKLTFDREAWTLIKQYSWPGNVRELINTIEQLYATCHTPTVRADQLPTRMRDASPTERLSLGGVIPLDLAERILVERALRSSRGNQARAAQMLGIERRRMYRLVRHHGLRALIHKTTTGD